jgi:hypothetical protein
MNKSMETGEVPDTLKLAKVIPIYKANEKDMFTNYRPISLLPCFSKILEKLMHKRVYSFLVKHNMLYNSQYGFRPKHSTTYAIIELVGDIMKAYDREESMLAVFVDLSKAFDTIDHSILINKLERYGIRGIALKWFQNYLNNRSQFVSYNGITSKTGSLAYGVPQGSVLGPLLFIIYTNDLPFCSTSGCILFADDTTIYRTGKDIDKLYNTLQNDIDQLCEWFRSNRLSLNAGKTNYMLFYNKQTVHSTKNIIVDNNPINHANSVKFLGVIIDEQLTWSTHIDKCAKKISSGLYAINAVKNILNTKNLKILYHSLIQSHLNYCNITWGYALKKYTNRLTILQKKAIRNITKSTYNAHTSPLFKDHGLLKLEDICNIQIAKLMHSYTHDDLPTNLMSLFNSNTAFHSHNTRQHHDPHFMQYNTARMSNSFLAKCPKIWAQLPHNIKDINKTSTFIRNVKKIMISKY